MRQRFVLDTTALTDTGMREKEGFESICDSTNKLLTFIAKARLKLDISCYIPYPTVYNELLSFLKRYNCDEDVIAKMDTWLVKKTPNRYEVKIPAAIFYEYVLTMRQKINQGKKLAEEYLWESSAITSKLIGSKSSGDIEKEIGNLISRFRERYRVTLRGGILDSEPDIDVLLLAKELEAGVVSSDAGIRKWAEKLGLRYVEASKFPRMLREYLKAIGESED
ncbi:RNA ligase partner, MJ_0950 family [Archaeoglobus sulfaticallidus PM70-1]|uniref:RNA-free ribonuclease P n=1 Tax=Archaeoglobus sulfaticallidus PM70-1 TaxID=387631 RepID=N0BKG2_9EURY|nr:RNA ligase partner protein [Archaeoglobus sulfaticallidus]AGK60670.1 RNA ligase partner, MJ_0950 family [Archaeoglobus sulfaticallidus PM70-1]